MTQLALRQAWLADALVPLAFTSDNEGQPDWSANGNGHRINAGELVVIGSGPIPPNPGEFVGTPAVARVLDELRGLFDTVLIDTPPVLQVGDAISLSANVDALLVVCRLETVRRPALNGLRRVLDTSPAEKLGFVLADAESEEGYGYGYGYGQSAYFDRVDAREQASVS
jgi:Mrp family chromosome partitioning ATPase